MSNVVRGRFDAENLAIQLLTDTASYITHQQIHSISDDYHQSQQASRGAGHITQASIEQQWETQLINDAKLTANTQLPSVRFDVNDAYVSQQLGQRVGGEVSHFYHPTSIATNSNGFWRGVDDVLEMREGTSKAADLIFTGHYEAPRNSWETAGFVLGVPLAMGAMAEVGLERLGAEALETIYQESQQLGKGLIKAASLANRWGFFGHNDVESSELFINQFSNHEIYSPHTIPLAQLKNINGKWNYIVNSDGKLIVGKGGQFPGGGHIDLANGLPIKAAGEVKIINGQIKYIDNSSGHYLPVGISARQIAEEAFSKLGFDTLNKYIEKKWIEDTTIRNGGAWRPNL